MNAFGFKRVAVLFVSSLIGSFAGAASPATPVKYCESLAATSCEVLNVEMGSCIDAGGCAGMIKYCRNQKFQVVPFYYLMGSSDGFARFYLGGSQVANSSIANPTGISAMNSTTLCTQLP